MGMDAGPHRAVTKRRPAAIKGTAPRGPRAGISAELGALAFRCPTIARITESGIETDADTLLRIRNLSALVYCRNCNRHHEFSIASGSFTPFGSTR